MMTSSASSSRRRRRGSESKSGSIFVLVAVALMAGATWMRSSSSTASSASSSTSAHHGRRRHLAESEERTHEEDALMQNVLELDHFRIGWMMMSIVLLQALLDGILRRVEMSVTGSARVLLTEIYKELSTLGIISFVLFLVQAFVDKIEQETLHAFEFSHILTFSFALCYILQSSVLIHSIGPITRELVKLNTLAVVGLGRDRALESQVERTHGCRTDCLDPHLFGGFQEFRDTFLQQHGLPSAFLYDHYLTEIYQHWVLTRLEVSEWCWGFLVVVFGIHMYTSQHSDMMRFFLHPITFLGYGWVIFGLDLILYGIVRRAHLRVLQTIRTKKAEEVEAEEDKDETLDEKRAVLECEPSFYSTHSSPPPETVVAELKKRRRELLISLQEQQEEEKMDNTKQQLTKERHRFSTRGIGSLHNHHHHHHHHHHQGILRHGHHATDVAVKGAEACSFTPWERRTFEWGTQILSILRCLYMAAYLCAFILPSFKRFSTGTAVLIVLSTPIPAILSGAMLIPAMVCKYLLVKSAGVITIEALDAVVDKMDLVEQSFLELSLAVQRLVMAEKEKKGEEEEEVDEDKSLAGLLAALDEESCGYHRGFIHQAVLYDLLHESGVALSDRHFDALARFLDLRQDKTVNVSDFTCLLQAKEVFNPKGPQALQRRQSARLVMDTSVLGAEEEEEEDVMEAEGQIELKVVG